MSEFLHRLKQWLSRVGFGDRATAIGAASIVIVLALIATALQSSSSDEKTEAKDASATSEQTDSPETGDLPGLGSGGESSTRPSGSAGSNAPSSETITGSRRPAALVPISNTTIKVGIAYITDPGAANAAAGFGGIGQVDQKRAWDAAIKDINKNPAYGRKIVPVYFPMSTNDITSKGQERLEQEACAHYTQDNKVFMVWGGALGGDTLSRCLTKAKVPLLGGGGGLSYSKTYKDFPYLVSPNDAAMDRMGAFEVDNLHKQGFFSKFKDNKAPYSPQKPADGKPRIGLIRYDQPSYEAGAAAMKRRLAAHGLSVCSGCEFEIGYSSDNIQEQLDDATEVNAAIQNCKSRPGGPCTHMLFLGSTAGVRITLFFVDGAEKQAYRPRLGLNPLDAPGAVTDFLGSASYPQFRQSVLVTDGPGEFNVKTDAFKKCKKLMEDAGESFSGDEGANKELQITIFCDPAWYTQSVLRSVGTTLNVDTFMHAVDHMSPVPSAQVYLMQTKTGRHDGTGAVRVGEWFDNCNCFKPTTGIIPV